MLGNKIKTAGRRIIDFTELAKSSPRQQGEPLEQLTRLLAERLGFDVEEWSGRGADNQKDLIILQTHQMPISYQVRWLVSCKDNSQAGKATSELPANLETLMRNSKALGFLLVTTTYPSSSAKYTLDEMKKDGRLFTDVWDSAWLIHQLLTPNNHDLFRQFFPESFKAFKDVAGGTTIDLGLLLERFSLHTRLSSQQPRIPGLTNTLEREEGIRVEELLCAKKPVLLVGEPGVGKSGIGFALLTPKSNPNMPMLLLDARRLSNVRDIGDFATRIGTNEPIATSIERLARLGGCRVIIDQLDSAVAAQAGNAFMDLALQCVTMEGVEVIVISRQREGYERKMLNKLVGDGCFVRIECDEISDGKVLDVLRQIGIDVASDTLVHLSKNLLNLYIIADIKLNRPDYDFGLIDSQAELWEGFVNALRSNEGRSPDPTFGDQVVNMAEKFASEGLKTEDRTFFVEKKCAVVQRLESWGIIVCDEGGRRYRFVHEELQNFLYARHAVDIRYMPNDVSDDIGPLRSRSVLLWMQRLYHPPHRARFLKELFSNG